MKHVIYSAPGTPLAERTVGELVAERPGLSRVFQQYKIDFCCQGARTVRESCEGNGIAEAEVVQALEAAQSVPAPAESNPADLPLDQLADYIVDTHHAYLRSELPRLHTMAEKVARVHGPRNGSLLELFHVFIGLENELTSHLGKEEMILFPAVHALCNGEAPHVFLGGPVAQMMHEHEAAGTALGEIRRLTNEFVLPERACNTYRALFAGLEELEADLHRHIHLENSVLFPAALALAQASQ